MTRVIRFFVFFSLFCSLPSNVHADECIGLFDRATQSVYESESKYASLNDLKTEYCSSKVREQQRSSGGSGGLKISIPKVVAVGLSGSGSNAKTTYTRNELCSLIDKKQSEESGEREYVKKTHDGYFRSYETCTENSKVIKFTLENSPDMKHAIISIANRNINFDLKIQSMNILNNGKSGVVCYHATTKQLLNDLDMPLDVDKDGLSIICEHFPEIENESKVSYELGTLFITTNGNNSAQSYSVNFPASEHIRGESLDELRAEISELRKLTNDLQIQSFQQEEKLKTAMIRSKPINISSNEFRTADRVGHFFNFEAGDVDDILCRRSWHTETFVAMNSRTKRIATVRLWRHNDGGTTGNATGRWEPATYTESDKAESVRKEGQPHLWWLPGDQLYLFTGKSSDECEVQ